VVGFKNVDFTGFESVSDRSSGHQSCAIFLYKNLVRLITPLLLEDDESKARGSVVSPAQLVLLFYPA